MHPDDLRKVKSLAPPPLSQRSLSTPNRPLAPMMSRQSLSSPSLDPPRSPRRPVRSPMGSRQDSLQGRNQLLVSQSELHKYIEEEEEDYSDVFGGQGEASTLGESLFLAETRQSDSERPRLIHNLGSNSTQSLQLTRRSNKSWLGDEEDDTSDPFAEIGDDFSGGADDLEANLLRDQRATLCGNISRIVDSLQPATPAAALIAGCDELVRFILPYYCAVLTHRS